MQICIIDFLKQIVLYGGENPFGFLINHNSQQQTIKTRTP